MTAIRSTAIDLALDEWLVHLDGWVIEDGNYPDLEVGASVESALAFEATNIRDASGSQPSIHRTGADYRMVAPIERMHRRLWIIEYGPKAYAERLEWRRGDGVVSMTARFFLDPFPFREGLGRLPGVPQIEHEWHVTGLWLHQASRGAAPIGEDIDVEAIERTDAVNDDGGTARYLVRGRLVR